MLPVPSSTTDALSSKVQESQISAPKRDLGDDDQNSINAKRPRHSANQDLAPYNPQDALNNSAFANIPFETRKRIFFYALVSDQPIDESDPKVLEHLSPALGDVCQLFRNEGKELYFSKNEFVFKDFQKMNHFVESNSPFTHLVQKIRFDSNVHYGDRDLSTLSANGFWNKDDMSAILRLENLEVFTLSMEWHFSNKMFKLMERLFRHVKKLFEQHGVFLERLSIVSKPEKEKNLFFLADPPAESIRVHGSRIDGQLRKADVPIILGHQGEMIKPGDEEYDLYTRQNTYIRDPKADAVDNGSIKALNMGTGLDQ